MAESSEGANNSHEQEMDAGMEQHSAGLAAGHEVLLLADVAEGADPPAHVTRLLHWIRQDAGHAAGLGAAEDADDEDADMDALLGLVYVLVLETGFTPLDEDFVAGPRGALDVGNLRRVARMPRGWRSREPPAGPRYVLDLALGPGDAAAARLVGVVCSGTLIVNMIAADAGFSVVLEPGRFVRPLRNLRALSLAVKDAVSGRARALIMNARGLSNPSLLGLPAELHAMLAAMLPVHDLYHLAASCSALQHLIDDQGLWRLQLRRHHPELFRQLEDREAEAEAVDWKKEFRAKRAEEQAAAVARNKEMNDRLVRFMLW